MIDAAEVLADHFGALADILTGVELDAIEEAAWALLIEIERLEKGLCALPAGPDFQRYSSAQELAEAARQRIDVMDAHLISAQRAKVAIGALLGAFEDALAAGQQAEYLVNEIDRQILQLQQGTTP